MTDEANCYRVPLDRYPGMNRLVLDWLAGDQRFLPRGGHQASPASRRPVDADLLDALTSSNRRWGLDVSNDLRRWAAGETATIIAGQQVGFAGGPLYTLVKMASLLKLKRDNEARGVATTIFFWLATEDHDFAEAATIALPAREENRQRDLIFLRATRDRESRQVIGRSVVPEQLVQQLTATLSISRPSWLRPGITFADSFSELIVTALGSGFILIDALLPELRRAGASLFESIVNRWEAIQSTLADRSAKLESAGYTPQIAPRPGEPYTLLYSMDAAGNRELMHHPSTITDPRNVSTSAVTRPLLQAFVIRPDIFVGGPAEVAYYAQIAPLHHLLGLPLPQVALRGHVLVGPRRIVRSLTRFGIQPHEIFDTPEHIASAHAESGVQKIRDIAAQAERQLKAHIDKIRELSLPADHAVARSINRSIGHIEYHFKKLTERAIRGFVRKDKEGFRAARELASTFYPDLHVQDRVVGWFPLWVEYGQHLVQRVVDEVEPDTRSFKIVGL